MHEEREEDRGGKREENIFNNNIFLHPIFPFSRRADNVLETTRGWEQRRDYRSTVSFVKIMLMPRKGRTLYSEKFVMKRQWHFVFEVINDDQKKKNYYLRTLLSLISLFQRIRRLIFR